MNARFIINAFANATMIGVVCAVEGAWRFDIPSGLPTRRWRFVGFPSARV